MIENVYTEISGPYLGSQTLSVTYTATVAMEVECKDGPTHRECDWADEFAKMRSELKDRLEAVKDWVI